MTIHVLLTADNHLDPSAVQYGPKRFERKRDFQRCFEVLVNFALENKPDILLIGGDFYDGILPGNPTRAFVAEQFKHLHEKNIKTILVSGHNDTQRRAGRIPSRCSCKVRTRLLHTRTTSNKQEVQFWKRNCQRDRDEPQPIST